MDPAVLPVLNEMLVQLDRKNGSRAVAKDVLCSLAETGLGFEGDKSNRELIVHLHSLYNLFMACRPRMPHIIYDLQRLILFLKDNPKVGIEELNIFILQIRKEKRDAAARCTEYVCEFFKEGQNVLLHSYSMTIAHVLDAATETKDRPVVYVASQEPEKTQKLVRHLIDLDYEYYVVSEYSLSHIIKKLDLALFSALSFNTHNEVIMGPGSTSMISQLAQAGVDNYNILTKNKFSFWEEETDTAYQELRVKREDDLVYKKTVFSHDVVDVDLFTAIVTEDGLLTPEELKQKFKNLQQEFFRNEKIINSL